MRNIFKIWLLLLPIFALQACVEKDRQERQVIHQAELLMQEQPDSALHLLQTLQRHSLTGETLARYALIHSIAQDKSGLDVTSDSLLRIAYDYYCRHPKDSLYARSQYYMGKYYDLVDSTKQAEDCLRRLIGVGVGIFSKRGQKAAQAKHDCKHDRKKPFHSVFLLLWPVRNAGSYLKKETSLATDNVIVREAD